MLNNVAAFRFGIFCLYAVLFAGCTTNREPVTLNFPHGWAFRPDELATRSALSQRFTQETGIRVRDIPTPESTYDQLELYRRLLRQGSPGADLLGIDPIWSELLEPDLIDLRPFLSTEISSVVPDLLPGYTVGGKIVGVPYQATIGSLEYRADLLQQYGYDHPPSTWGELEGMAKKIQAGERAKGNKDFWGFVWQGAESEALMCNALEWQIGEGGGRVIESDRTISVNNPAVIRSWQRARRWVGSVSPPSVTAYRERDSMNVFDSGSAAFNRVWLGASTVRSGSSGQIYWRNLEPRVKTGFTSIPGGSGGSAGTLGGAGLAVSRHSAHPQEAVKLIQFILRAQVELIQTQKDMATSRGQIKNFSLVPDDYVKLIQKGGMVYRPSIEAGSKYEQVSAAYVHALHMVLIGQKEAPQAAAELEKQLVQITGFHVGPPARK